LHDTLLQGFQLLTLVFQSAMTHMSNDDPNRETMGQALGQADKVLLEARNAIRDLRADEDASQDLAEALREVANRCPRKEPIDFQLSSIGETKLLKPGLREELYRIGQAALINAYQHSRASRIDVEINYGADRMDMVIRDNGIGISQDVLAHGRKGHWGLSGMRERAQNVGGELAIQTDLGKGTQIVVTMPAKIAYVTAGNRSGWGRFTSLLPKK
jgi:signal transduction histidine kinase